MNKKTKRFLALLPACLLLLPVFLSVFFCPVVRAAGNTSKDKALAIAVNTFVSDSQSRINEKHYYQFSLNTDGVVTFECLHEAFDDPYKIWSVSLCTDKMTSLCSIEAVGKEAQVQSPEIGLPAGHYYLTLTTSNNHFSGAPYRLRVNFTASDAWETERNDNKGSADPIGTNKLYSASLHKREEKDYFKFHLETDGFITFDCIHAPFDDPYVFMSLILNDDKMGHLCTVKSVGKEAQVTSPEIGLPAGTYYLHATGESTHFVAATYQFRVNFTPSDAWETEHNDNKGSADLIAANKLYSASIHKKGGDDYFKFRLETDGFITFDCIHEPFDDPYVFMSLALNDEKMEHLCTVRSVGKEAQVTSPEIGLPAGTYYLHAAGDSTRFFAGTYQFRVNFTPSDAWETERNNNKSNADPVETNKLYSASICKKEEEDYYKFTLPSDSIVSLLFEHQAFDDPGAYWTANLYTDTMNRLGSSITVHAKESRVQGEQVELKAGTYYLRVSAGSAYSAATYHFSVLTNDGVHLYRLGDINLDGFITAEDARLALRAAVGLENYPVGSPQFIAGDTDRKGEITAWDARRILRAAVGLETLA